MAKPSNGLNVPAGAGPLEWRVLVVPKARYEMLEETADAWLFKRKRKPRRKRRGRKPRHLRPGD